MVTLLMCRYMYINVYSCPFTCMWVQYIKKG